MANRDIIVLNTSQSRAETQQGSDTVRIKGVGEILSIENSSASPILTVQSSGSQTILSGSITSTGNLTGVTTGSFGKVEGTTLIGSAFELTNTDLEGTLSASSQIASQITGSFRRGFEFTGTISGSGGSTGSFDRIVATTFVGDAFNLGKSSELPNTVSASSTIAADISGSFNKGFEFVGTIKRTLGAWTATNAINTARTVTTAFGSQNAAVLAGGNTSPNAQSETWNGTNWSEGNDLNTGRHALASAGTATAGLVFGGNPAVADTETYGGTDYSEVNNLNTGRYGLGGWGTQTSAIAVGGAVSEYNNICALTECWNGTNWSEVADLNAARWYMGTAGDSSESGIVFGGSYASPAFAVGIATTEQWNGSSWSEVNDLNVNLLYTRGQGSTNNAIAAGGLINSPTNTFSTCTETWDGTSWSIEASLNVASRYLGIGGNGEGAIAAGFSVPASPYASTNSELFQATLTTGSFGTLNATTLVGSAANLTNHDKTNTISSSAQLASRISGSFNKGFDFDGEISGSMLVSASFNRLTAHTLVGDGSTLTNTIPTGTVSGSAQVASDVSGSFNKGFEYTGTIEKAPPAWSKGPAVPHNTSRTHVATGDSPNAIITVSGTGGDTWNGSSWSEITAAPNPTSYGMATGAYDATLIVGGNRSGSISWNGSTWTEEASTNRDMTVLAAGGAGTTEAALVFGGNSGSADVGSSGEASAETEAYDGTSWSECNDLLYPRAQGFQTGIGTQNSTIAFGGCGTPGATIDPPSPYSDFTFTEARTQGDHLEEWNGTNWTYRGEYYAHPGLSYFMHSGAGVGTANAASFFGGYTRALGGSGINYSHYHWDGTAMSDGVSMLIPLSYNKGAGQGGATGAHANVGGYSAGANAAPTYNLPGYFQFYESFVNSGSFGQVKALQFVGDGANITDFTKPSNIHSASAQFTGISASFNKGFEFVGTISSSAQSTGSFGQIVATTFSGDGSNLTNTALTGTVSSSIQIDSDIKGAFNKGFKYSGDIRSAKGVWSTSNNLNSARRGLAGTGTQNAGLATGGANATPYHSNAVNLSEEYNGDSWTEGDNLISARTLLTGVGTQNAALFYGGWNTTTATEEYNGTSYATGGSLSQGGYAKIGFGVQNAAFSTAGTISDHNGIRTESEQYDGASWSNSVPMITPRFYGGAGSVNAGITSYGFRNLTYQTENCTELWNGTSWSETSEAVISGQGAIEYGTQNAFVVTAGAGASPAPGIRATTQFFDGTAYSFDGDLNTLGMGAGARASQDAGLVFGGANPGVIANTEEYNTTYYTTGSFTRVEADDVQIANNSQLVVSASLQLPVFVTNEGIVSSSAGQMWFNSSTRKLNFTMDVNSWSAGGDMIDARTSGGGAGVQNAAIAVAGTNPSISDLTEVYNGSTWSEVSELDVPTRVNATSGTSNAALNVAGLVGSPQVASGKTEQWDGSTWSETPPDVNTNKRQAHMSGTANASLHFGGYPNLDDTEEWDGTAWYTAANMNQGRSTLGGSGTQNATIAHGGRNHPTTNIEAKTELYDGTSWSEVNDLNAARQTYTGGGTQNAAVAFGGGIVPSANTSTCTEEFNGTSWSVGNAMGTAGGDHFGGGSQAAAWGALAPGATLEYNVSHLKTVEIDGV